MTESSAGKYEFVRELGRGGMGIVFLARDRELERAVAIKVLSPSWLTDDAMVKRFQREARTIARLRHESIITVYHEGNAGGLFYFVMEYIEGVSLSRILRVCGPLPIPIVEAILYRVGSGLDYAHRPGREIVHRDVKPSNILIDTEGLAVLMDFGISRDIQAQAGLTRTGMLIGTPEYMSPEQCRGHNITAASDQYSLGAVVYAMLAGAPPFTGPFYQVLVDHESEPVPPLLAARPDCPPALAAATERMLAKHAGERWSSIREALQAMKLRPLPHGDPVLDEVARLVHECQEASSPPAGTLADRAHRRAPSSIRIAPAPDDVEVGDELELVATALFRDGIEERWGGVVWESTDPSVARVDPSTGRLVASGTGSAVILATGDGLSDSLAIEVKPPQVAEVTIEPPDVRLVVGESVRLHAEARSKRGEILDRSVNWSSSDPRTAAVSPDGILTARRSGSVSVLIHCDGVGTATVVRVEPEPDRVPGSPAGKPPADRANPVPWRQRAPWAPAALGLRAILQAAAARGRRMVQAHGALRGRDAVRSATVLRTRPLLWAAAALMLGGSGLWLVRSGLAPDPEARVVDVVVRAPDGVVGNAGLDAIAGDTLTLSATVVAADGSELEGTVTWTSMDPSVAAIDPTGVLVAVARGATRILATAEGTTRELTVTVEPSAADVVLGVAGGDGPVTGLELVIGRWIDLEATVLDRRGQPVPRESVTWRSSTPSVAAVDASGHVTGRAPGRAVITASAGELSGEARVAVVRPPETVVPEPGTLVLRIAPSWANVFVNGAPHGERSTLELRLPPGRHRLRLENPRMATVDTTFTVRSGSPVELNIRMRERND